MTDEIDLSSEREFLFTQDAIRKNAKPLAQGKPGECDLCGEHSERLVDGACAPCRDKWRLP